MPSAAWTAEKTLPASARTRPGSAPSTISAERSTPRRPRRLRRAPIRRRRSAAEGRAGRHERRRRLRRRPPWPAVRAASPSAGGFRKPSMLPPVVAPFRSRSAGSSPPQPGRSPRPRVRRPRRRRRRAGGGGDGGRPGRRARRSAARHPALRGNPAAARASSCAAKSGAGVGAHLPQRLHKLRLALKGSHRMPPSAWSSPGAAWCRRSTRRSQARPRSRRCRARRST